MRYALIGCGRISTNHIKAAVNNGLEITAVCDVVPEHMESLLEKHGLHTDTAIKRYTDYRKMIEENQIDLISIATESGLHGEIALYCIEHGLHVIIEKPMAMSMAEANQIITRSEEKKVKVAACHQNRFNIAVQEMRKALEADRFGPLSHGSIHVRWNRNQDYYAQAPWRGTWAQDGGALMNQCIHGIDLLRWMMGDEVESVYGITKQQFHHYLEAEDIGMAVVKFKNGAVATIEGTTNVYPQNLEETLYLFGEKGTVKLGGKSTNNIDVWNFSDETEEDRKNKGLEEATSNVYGNGHTSLFADMIEAIEMDRPPYVDAYAGKRALEMILAIYKSQKTGEVVKLPLEDFASVDMQGEFCGSTCENNGQETLLIPTAGNIKSKRIAVLTYDVPHQKTYDVLTRLKAVGYKNITVYGVEMHYKKESQPLIEHRPELNITMEPWDLCRNLGYDYKKITYQEIDLDDESIFLVAGAGILPKEFVSKYRIINSHPGYIPDCRGLDALKWAIYEGKPIGVTTHLLGEEIDAGEIIERKIIPLYANDTFYRLCERVYRNEIKMLVDAIELVGKKHESISGGNHVIHKRMPHECEKELLEKFEQMKSWKKTRGLQKEKETCNQK